MICKIREKCDRNMKMLRVVDIRKKERKKKKRKKNIALLQNTYFSEFQWESKLTPSMQKCFDEKGFFVAKWISFSLSLLSLSLFSLSLSSLSPLSPLSESTPTGTICSSQKHLGYIFFKMDILLTFVSKVSNAWHRSCTDVCCSSNGFWIYCTETFRCWIVKHCDVFTIGPILFSISLPCKQNGYTM